MLVKPSHAWRRKPHPGCAFDDGTCACVPPLAVLAVEALCVRGPTTSPLGPQLEGLRNNDAIFEVLKAYKRCNSLRPVDSFVQRLCSPLPSFFLDLAHTNFCAIEPACTTLKSLTGLLALDLTGTALANDSFARLCQSVPNLVSLCIAGCKLSEAGLRYLSDIPRLQYVDVRVGVPIGIIRNACSASSLTQVRIEPAVATLAVALAAPAVAHPHLLTLDVSTFPSLTIADLQGHLRQVGERISGVKAVLEVRLEDALVALHRHVDFWKKVLLQPFVEGEFLDVARRLMPVEEPKCTPSGVEGPSRKEEDGQPEKRARLTLFLPEPTSRGPTDVPLSLPSPAPSPLTSPRLVGVSPARFHNSVERLLASTSAKVASPRPSAKARLSRSKLRDILQHLDTLRFTHSKHYRELLQACVPYLNTSLATLNVAELHKDDVAEYRKLCESRDRMAKQLQALN